MNEIITDSVLGKRGDVKDNVAATGKVWILIVYA